MDNEKQIEELLNKHIIKRLAALDRVQRESPCNVAELAEGDVELKSILWESKFNAVIDYIRMVLTKEHEIFKKFHELKLENERLKAQSYN